MKKLFVITFFTLLTLIDGEIVQFQACSYPDSVPIVNNCTIHELRVNPCKEARSEKPCRIKRGKNASIEFDYTTIFEGEKLESRAYWASQLLIDLPLLGMDSNACAYTTCPAKPGAKQTYTMILPIFKTYPANTYDVKWKLWNEQEQECCFIFQIKLQK